MTKRVLISPRVCTDRCLQSRAVSAALLPHCPATGELTPPPKDLLGQRGPLPWASVTLGHWPACWGCWLPTCPALLTAVEVQSSIRAYKSNRTDFWLWPVCLVGFLTVHICRGQFLTAGQTLHLADALSSHQPFQQLVHAPLPGWCSLFLCLAVQPWNGTCLHRDL